jgi:hypothetical protein
MIYVELPKGQLCITGHVDAEALRTVLGAVAGMIGLAAGTRVLIVAGVTDMRRGFVGLSGMVKTALMENPFSGQVFVFRGKRGKLSSKCPLQHSRCSVRQMPLQFFACQNLGSNCSLRGSTSNYSREQARGEPA